MTPLRLREGETLDSLLARFKRQYKQDGTLEEWKKHEHFLKKSLKRKEKSKKARQKK